MDSAHDTHRHPPHLVGLYLGYAATNYNPSYRLLTPTSRSSPPQRRASSTGGVVLDRMPIKVGEGLKSRVLDTAR